MDPGFRSPLIDFFRRGEVAHDVRLLAAQGALAPRAHEQLALLILLSDDPDAAIAASANATLDRLPPTALAAFLARSDVPAPMREFFTRRGAVASGEAAADAATPLLDTSAADANEAGGDTDDEPESQLLSGLSIIERMKLAMKGTRAQRAQLVRDSNKLVAAAVLSSPKLTEVGSGGVREDGERDGGGPPHDRDEPDVDEELRGDCRAREEPEDAAGDLDEPAAAAERARCEDAHDGSERPRGRPPRGAAPDVEGREVARANSLRICASPSMNTVAR